MPPQQLEKSGFGSQESGPKTTFHQTHNLDRKAKLSPTRGMLHAPGHLNPLANHERGRIGRVLFVRGCGRHQKHTTFAVVSHPVDERWLVTTGDVHVQIDGKPPVAAAICWLCGTILNHST